MEWQWNAIALPHTHIKMIPKNSDHVNSICSTFCVWTHCRSERAHTQTSSQRNGMSWALRSIFCHCIDNRQRSIDQITNWYNGRAINRLHTHSTAQHTQYSVHSFNMYTQITQFLFVFVCFCNENWHRRRCDDASPNIDRTFYYCFGTKNRFYHQITIKYNSKKCEELLNRNSISIISISNAATIKWIIYETLCGRTQRNDEVEKTKMKDQILWKSIQSLSLSLSTRCQWFTTPIDMATDSFDGVPSWIQ